MNLKKKHFKSNIHKQFDKCKHIKLTIEKPNINDVVEIFQAYIIEHFKKYDFYLMKCEFKWVFYDNQCCPYVTSDLYSYRTMWSWYIFLEIIISDFKDKA